MCVCLSIYPIGRSKKEGINEKEGGGHQEFLKSAEKGHASRLAGPFAGISKAVGRFYTTAITYYLPIALTSPHTISKAAGRPARGGRGKGGSGAAAGGPWPTS